jgi:hypothetical protein
VLAEGLAQPFRAELAGSSQRRLEPAPDQCTRNAIPAKTAMTVVSKTVVTAVAARSSSDRSPARLRAALASPVMTRMIMTMTTSTPMPGAAVAVMAFAKWYRLKGPAASAVVAARHGVKVWTGAPSCMRARRGSAWRASLLAQGCPHRSLPPLRSQPRR